MEKVENNLHGIKIKNYLYKIIFKIEKKCAGNKE